MQFGGGISTAVALKAGSAPVTVAEGNPAVLTAFRDDKGLRDFTGDILNNPKVTVIDYDGRLYLAHTENRYDVIDLSLADSAGLSSPGGFAIVEKYSYTREAMSAYMRALKAGGILSVTLWNKEEPPKSVLKLYATMAAAARDVDGADIANDFFVASTYLSTATVLYKRGGFTPEEIAKLREHTRGDVVRRDLLSRLRVRHGRDCSRSSRTTATRSSSQGDAGRSDGPVGEGAQRQAAARHDDDRRRQDRRRRKSAAASARAGHRARPARLAPPDARRLGDRSPTSTSSTRACSPTTGRTSPPTSR